MPGARSRLVVAATTLWADGVSSFYMGSVWLGVCVVDAAGKLKKALFTQEVSF